MGWDFVQSQVFKFEEGSPTSLDTIVTLSIPSLNLAWRERASEILVYLDQSWWLNETTN
jgi:hypothetical protein